MAGSGQNALAWSAVPGATSYSLYGNSGLLRTGLTGTAYTDTGLTNGQSYGYYVVPVSANGNGSRSNTVTLTPGAAALPASLLSAETSPYQSYIALNWAPVPGATQYDLYRGTSPGGEGAAPYQINIASSYNGVLYTRYTDPPSGGLTAGTTYYYEVAAVGPGGDGALSNEASVTVGATPLPAPQLKGVAGSGQSALAWSAVAGATSYNLYRNSSLFRTGLTAATFTDTGLTNGQSYDYFVTAVSAGGEGEWSNDVSLTPGAAALPAPQLTAGSSPDQGSDYLNWTPVPGALQYDVYRGTSPGGEGSVPYQAEIDMDTDGMYGVPISFVDPPDDGSGSVTAGTTYYYKVAAVGPGGEGALSNEASATVGADRLPAPSGLTATPAAHGGQSVALSWGAVPGAASYNVYRPTDPDQSIDGTSLYKMNVSGTTFTDTGVIFGPTYYYVVTAVCVDGEGNCGSPVSATLYGFGLADNGASPFQDVLTANAPASVTVARGTVGAVSVAVAPTGGYHAPLAFGGSGLPAGVSAWFYGGPFTLPTVSPSPWQAGQPGQAPGGGITANLYVAVSAAATPGTYTFPVTGTSTSGDGFANTATVTLTIN